jgi:hypothetical protein
LGNIFFTSQLPCTLRQGNIPALLLLLWRFVLALALVHQRFSTNTFPSWRWRIPTA